MKNSFAKINDVKKHFALLMSEMQDVTGGATQQTINKLVNYYGVVHYYGVIECYGIYHDDDLLEK